MGAFLLILVILKPMSMLIYPKGFIVLFLVVLGLELFHNIFYVDINIKTFAYYVFCFLLSYVIYRYLKHVNGFDLIYV